MHYSDWFETPYIYVFWHADLENDGENNKKFDFYCENHGKPIKVMVF